MEIVKYNREDVFPIVLTVLDYTAYYLGCIILNFVIKDHHPDLRGKLDTRCLQESEFQLINEVDDPNIAMMRYMHNDIQSPIYAIMNLYALHGFYEDEEDEGRIDDLADTFYWSNIMFGFPLDDQIDLFDDQDYVLNLDLYIFSAVDVIKQLIVLIDTEETNLGFMGSKEDMLRVMNRNDYVGKPHAQVFGYLFDLIDQLWDYKINFWKKNTDPAYD